MKELSPRKVSALTNISTDELKQMKKDYPFRFESLMLGATILNEGHSIGEVLFTLQRRSRTDILLELKEAKERIVVLESVHQSESV